MTSQVLPARSLSPSSPQNRSQHPTRSSSQASRWRRRILELSTLLAVACSGVAQLRADVAGTLDTTFPNLDAVVAGLVTQPDGKIIISATFTPVGGTRRSGFARLNADGSVDETFKSPSVNGAKNLVLQPDGKILLGSMRLNANGSVDTTANFKALGDCVALQPDGKILVGGTLNINGDHSVHVARMLPDGSLDPTFNASIPKSALCLTVQPDEKIVVGTTGVLRLTATGSQDQPGEFARSSSTIQGTVLSLLVQPDGRILVGANQSITRLNADGTLDASFDPGTGPNGAVMSIARQVDGKILIAGSFDKVNGQPRAHVARLDANGHLEDTSTFNAGTLGLCSVVALQGDGTILLGGSFTQVNGQVQAGLARLLNDPATQSLTTPHLSQIQWLRSGTTVEVNRVTFETSTSGLVWSPLGAATPIPGGWQRSGLNLTAGGLIRARAVTATGITETVAPVNVPIPGTIDPGFPNLNTEVTTLALQPDGKVIVVGPFTSIGDVARNHLARINPDGSVDPTFVPDAALDFIPSCLILQANGQILLGGRTEGTVAGGAVRLVRLNQNGSLEDAATFHVAGDSAGSIRSMVLRDDGKILVGGEFSAIGGVPRTNLALLNADGSVNVDYQPPSPLLAGPVNSLVFQVDNSNLPTRSIVVSSGSVLARVSADGLVVTRFSTVVDSPVRVLVTEASGLITAAGEGIPGGILRLKQDGTRDTTFNAQVDGIVRSIAKQVDGKILIAGDFNTVNGEARAHLAQLNNFGSLASLDSFNTGTSGPVAVVALQGDGKILVGGSFTQVNGQPQAGLTRLQNGEATQHLFSYGPDSVRWERFGAAPNSFLGTIELSIDGGTHWSFLGYMRINGLGGLGGLNLPDAGLLRARTSTPTGIIESIGTIDLVTEPPLLTLPLSGTVVSHALTVGYTLPENSAPGLLQLNFRSPDSTIQTINLGFAGVEAGSHLVTFDPAKVIRNGIPDGTYELTISYIDDVGRGGPGEGFATSAPKTNITVDTVAPVLFLPAPIAVEVGNDGFSKVDFAVSSFDLSDPHPLVTVSPPSGSLFHLGLTTVNVTATDWAGNTATGSFTVKVQDTTKPVITAPPGGFTPLVIVVPANGTAVWPDYTTQVTTSDAGGELLISQSPRAGTPAPLGKTTVKITAFDPGGNFQTLSFEVNVISDGPSVQSLAGIGGDVPGAGVDPRIPAGAKFTRVGIPAVADDRSVAYLGKWTGTAGVETGIFAGIPAALLVKTGDNAPGIEGAQFDTLSDPLLAPDGTVAYRGTVRGATVKPANNEGVWWYGVDGTQTILLRKGVQVPVDISGLPSTMKSIAGLSFRSGNLLVTGLLTPKKNVVSEANDSVLVQVNRFYQTPLIREGELLDFGDGYGESAVQTIQSLVPTPGSPAQGRWQSDYSALAKISLKDGRRVILDFFFSPQRSVAVGDGVANLPAQVLWKGLNTPAIAPNGRGMVLRGVLTSLIAPGLPKLVTTANDVALALSPTPDAPFSVFAREGSPAPNTNAKFAAFLDPIVNDTGKIAFSATLAGTGVTTTNNTGLWWGAPDEYSMLARTNGSVPGPDGATTTAKWSSFDSLVLPGGGAGPIFLAHIRGAGVPLNQNIGVWGVNADGQLRQLLRTGDLIDGKAVIGIQAFADVPGASGGARGFNAHGTIAVRVTLTGGGQAIVRIDIPSADQ